MSYLPFTILAYALNSLAVTIDKFLLTKAIPNPLMYIFYISLFSLLALLLLPLTHSPSLDVFWLSSASTLLWTAGAYMMFKALKIGQTQRVIPVIGALTPLILLIHAAIGAEISVNEAWAAGVLIIGLIFMTLDSWLGKIKRREIVFEILSSLLFALSYLILKEAFDRESFLTVLVWSRWILIPLGMILLLIPKFKKEIFFKGPQVDIRSGPLLLFIIGQTTGGASGLLLTFSISLTNPALVNSLQGIQYVFLLGLALVLAKKFPHTFGEKSSFRFLSSKILGIGMIALGLFILAFSQAPKAKAQLGVTFSPRYAHELGLNPKSTYVKMLDELGVNIVRLPVYWDEIEQFPQKLNFEAADFYLEEAQIRGVEVVLVLGYKQPRWPECFVPPWAKNGMRQDKEVRILNLIKQEVAHFKKYQNITFWQVENEPLVSFGVCEGITQSTHLLLKKEVETVKSLDARPVMITDSGELSMWLKTIQNADSLGISLYRTVWNPIFGLTDYPLPPIFYSLKANLLEVLTGKTVPIIISELQAEPWIPGGRSIPQVSTSELVKLFPVKKLQDHISFAKETGFPQIYLWGVEWWYFMDKMGHPQYLDYARTLFVEQEKLHL